MLFSVIYVMFDYVYLCVVVFFDGCLIKFGLTPTTDGWCNRYEYNDVVPDFIAPIYNKLLILII